MWSTYKIYEIVCAQRDLKPYSVDISPNKTQSLLLRLTIYKYPRSRPFERLAVKVFSHPIIQVGSRSFILQYYALVFALTTPRADRSWL